MNALSVFLAVDWLGTVVGFVVAALLLPRFGRRAPVPDPHEDLTYSSDDIPAFLRRQAD